MIGYWGLKVHFFLIYFFKSANFISSTNWISLRDFMEALTEMEDATIQIH